MCDAFLGLIPRPFQSSCQFLVHFFLVGRTDFLHSVLGEALDKMVKSEVQELDSKL